MAPSTGIRIGFQPKEPKNSRNIEQRFNASLYWISNHTMKCTANEIWCQNTFFVLRQKLERPGAKCTFHSQPFTFQGPWDFWAKRAVQLSESAINFLAEAKICLFAAPIQTTRKNRQCIFGKFQNTFDLKEIFSQKIPQSVVLIVNVLESYWWIGFVDCIWVFCLFLRLCKAPLTTGNVFGYCVNWCKSEKKESCISFGGLISVILVS